MAAVIPAKSAKRPQANAYLVFLILTDPKYTAKIKNVVSVEP